MKKVLKYSIEQLKNAGTLREQIVMQLELADEETTGEIRHDSVIMIQINVEELLQLTDDTRAYHLASCEQELVPEQIRDFDQYIAEFAKGLYEEEFISVEEYLDFGLKRLEADQRRYSKELANPEICQYLFQRYIPMQIREKYHQDVNELMACYEDLCNRELEPWECTLIGRRLKGCYFDAEDRMRAITRPVYEKHYNYFDVMKLILKEELSDAS